MSSCLLILFIGATCLEVLLSFSGLEPVSGGLAEDVLLKATDRVCVLIPFDCVVLCTLSPQ
jgi:hypothetical protein